MVDTIILRLHDVVKYETLIRNMDTQNCEGITTATGKVDKAEISKLHSEGIKDSKEIIDILRRNHSGEFILKTKFAKKVNASNHYTIAYSVNYTANYIEFNFSIPKYIFGSNVVMFVEHNIDKEFILFKNATIEHNIEKAFERLDGFLKQFFHYEFLLCPVDLRDVEVHRIDVCYNQVFGSKQEALLYLEYQKRLKKKYTRDNEDGFREYATSLMYITKRYSAKIYHKGSEYTKNDLKEHERINKERGKQYFRTKDYQAFADNILRYELTLRTNFLNYQHKRNLFRKKCKFFQMAYKDYVMVESMKQKNDRIAKAVGKLNDEEKKAYLLNYPYEKISKDSRSMHKYVTKLITKRTRFMLAINEDARAYDKKTMNYSCEEALFSKGLLKLALGKLFEFIDEFAIKELPSEEIIKKLIADYNSRHRIPLPTSEMIGFYKKLSETGSFKETAKIYGLSRASYFRYKERFGKIGVTENNITPLVDLGVPTASLDLTDYHSAILYNPHFIDKSSLFLM